MSVNLLRNRTGAELSMLLVAFIWGTTFVIVKNGLNDIDPFIFLGLRFILAFAVLALFAWPQMRKVTRSTWLAGALLGFFLFVGYTFQTIGLKYTTASNAGFITGVSVVLVPLIDAVFRRQRPSSSTIITVLVAATGLYFLSVPAGSLHLSSGDWLVLVCAFGFAFHIVLVDRFSHRHNPVAITGIQILFVGVVCLVIGLLTETWPQQFTPNAVGAILVTSVLATSLAFLIQNGLQKYSTPTRFAVVLTMEPVFAALAGYFWAQEVFAPRAWLGAGLILFAMLVAILVRPSFSSPSSEL